MIMFRASILFDAPTRSMYTIGTRDREIEKIKKEIGKNFGSGYPADPTTIAFLKEEWDKHPEIFRKTWSSYKKVVQAAKQKGLDEF